MKIKPIELVRFFDGKKFLKSNINGPHIKAINAFMGEELLISLLCAYFRDKKWDYELVNEIVDDKPRRIVPRELKGRRKLDAWLKVKLENKEQKYLQCEVKNWTSYSPGGVSIKPDESADKESHNRFIEYIEKNKVKYLKCLSKVFEEMKPPATHIKEEILPCILFWFCIGTESSEPFFPVYLKDGTKLWVFSASRYLREHKCYHQELRLPDTDVLGLNMRWKKLGGMIGEI